MKHNPKRVRLAIIRYKLAARACRRLNGYNSTPSAQRTARDNLDKARGAMLATLGYDRVYSYMGEFTNLHERDFPNMISATSSPCYYDRHAVAEGRIYRHHGFASALTWADHAATMTACRQRALELQRTFERPPVDRFILGWSVIYPENDRWFMAAWRNNASGGYLTVIECLGLFEYAPISQDMMNEAGARRFFATLASPKFQEKREEYWQLRRAA